MSFQCSPMPDVVTGASNEGVVILPLGEGEMPSAAALSPALHSLAQAVCQNRSFTGRAGEVLLLPVVAGQPAILTGLGPTTTPQSMRRAIGAAVRHARSHRLACISLLPPADILLQQAAIEGALLAAYEFDHFRKEPATRLERIVLSGAWDETARRRAVAMGQATSLSRDLCNTPGNWLTPRTMAEAVAGIAAGAGLAAQILDEDALRRLGMGALLAVAQGSDEPARLIVLEHAPIGHETEPPLVLVGKSVTFDSGGISLKVALDMDQMKADMSGGAAVVAAIEAAARLGIKKRIIALLPVVENMPGGAALRPGDIITTAAGLTIDVLNTDAEGRLILADALHHARSFSPDLVIDLATLTGASATIFGPVMNGFFSTAPDDAAILVEAGHLSGEEMWELPLHPAYGAMLKAPNADLRNIAGQKGATMIAAAFLQPFVGEAPWLHLDIYNTCWNDTDDPLLPKGATGCGTRALLQFLLLRHGG